MDHQLTKYLLHHIRQRNQVFGGDIRMTSFLFGETVNEVEVINEVNLDWSKEKVIFLDTEVTFKNRVLSTDFSC